MRGSPVSYTHLDHVHIDQVFAEVIERHGRLHGEAGLGQLLHQLLILAQVAGVGPPQNDPAAGALLHSVDDEVDVEIKIGVARADDQVVQVEKDGNVIGHVLIPDGGRGEKSLRIYPFGPDVYKRQVQKSGETKVKRIIVTYIKEYLPGVKGLLYGLLRCV